MPRNVSKVPEQSTTQPDTWTFSFSWQGSWLLGWGTAHRVSLKQPEKSSEESWSLSACAGDLAAVSGGPIFKRYLELWPHFPSQSWRCRTCHTWVFCEQWCRTSCLRKVQQKTLQETSERLQLSLSHQKGNKCRPQTGTWVLPSTLLIYLPNVGIWA